MIGPALRFIPDEKSGDIAAIRASELKLVESPQTASNVIEIWLLKRYNVFTAIEFTILFTRKALSNCPL